MQRTAVIRDFLWRNKWRYLAGFAALLAVDTVQLITPKLVGRMADRLQSGRLIQSDLLFYALIIVGLACFTAFGRYLWRMKMMGAARFIDCELREKLFLKLQSLSAKYFNRHKTGDLMAHATNDIQAVRMAAGHGIVLAVDSLFLATTTVIILIRTIDWRLTLLALLPLPFLAAVVIYFGRQIHKRFLRVQESFSEMTHHAEENLAGIRVVKSFVQEREETETFRAKSLRNVELNLRLIRISAIFWPLISLISAISFLIVLAYGGSLVVTGGISLGDFVAFLNYLQLLVWPMTAVGWVINMVQRGLASMDRLNVVLGEKPDVADDDRTLDLREIRGEVTIRDLTFAYPGAEAPVLRGINLTLPKGKTLAVVGRTGSGKSTLVNLLLRLHNPPEGTVFVDGIDINRLPLATLRRHIGCVPQDNFLFSTTVRENIGFAGTDYGDAEIESAAAIAQVHKDIADFPEHYATVVGERGVTLSGGQKQRVSIARALIKNPRLLILDDCLSAVDTNTEREILRGLKRIMSERTSIIISHRISAVQDADEIVVLDAGRLIGRGTHASLLAQGGLYADLYRKQLLEEELEQAE